MALKLQDYMTSWLQDSMTPWFQDSMILKLHDFNFPVSKTQDYQRQEVSAGNMSHSRPTWLQDSITQWLHYSITPWLNDCIAKWLHDSMNTWLMIIGCMTHSVGLVTNLNFFYKPPWWFCCNLFFYFLITYISFHNLNQIYNLWK